MNGISKISNIFREEGLKGILFRIKSVVVSIPRKIGKAVRRALYENPNSLLFNLSNFRRDYRLTQEAQQKIRESGLRSINDLDMAKIKRSDTLFILGSGASVNELREKDWEYIASCNSVGFNYWMAHPFVPDLYFTEPPPNETGWTDFLQINEVCKDNYSNVPYIVNFKEWQKKAKLYPLNSIPQSLKENLYYYSPFYLRLNKPWIIKLTLLGWKSNAAKPDKFDWLILQRASLGMLIMFGLFAGFKNIVLIGVDLSNTRYFFEDKAREFKFRPNNLQTQAIHRTVDDTLDINRISITIDKYIYLLNDVLLKPAKVSLYVSNEKSLLYPIIPLYRFVK